MPVQMDASDPFEDSLAAYVFFSNPLRPDHLGGVMLVIAPFPAGCKIVDASTLHFDASVILRL